MTDTAPDRATARLFGYRYYQGPPCKRGHVGIRYPGNGACRDCTEAQGKQRRASGLEIEQDRERRRHWRQANPDKVREAKRRHRHRRAARPELTQARLHRDAMAKLTRLSKRLDSAYGKLLRRIETRQRLLVRDRLKQKRRRARTRGAQADATDIEILLIYALQRGCCAYCGSADNLHLDHKTPIARGGHHTAGNLQFLCAFHNNSKGAKTDAEYRELKGIALLTPWDAAAGRLLFYAAALG